MTRHYEYPATARFTCRACGDCCRSFDVPVADAEVARLRALDWTSSEPSLVGLDPAVSLPHPSGGLRHRLPRRADGACAFLDPGTSRCLIHVHFGGDAKPLACRLYPFSFLRLGEAVAVDVAFSCSAVAAGMGAPLAAHLPAWERLVDEGGGEPPALEPRLRQGRGLPPGIVRELEAHLAGLLAEPGLGLTDRLRCAVRYVRLALTGDATTAAAATLREALRAGLPRQVGTHETEPPLDATQRAVLFQWLYVALNPPPAGADVLRGNALQAERRRRVAEADRYRKAGQRPLVGGRELRITHEDVLAVAPGILRDDGDGKLVGFLRAKLIGQRFLHSVQGDVPFVLAAHQLLFAAPMVGWTARALAADAGRSAVGSDDVRGAIRLVDVGIGQVSVTSLPKKQARAFELVLTETGLITAAARDLLGE